MSEPEVSVTDNEAAPVTQPDNQSFIDAVNKDIAL